MISIIPIKIIVLSIMKALLGLLPIIALLIFSLKCYFVVKYRRMWAVTSYYKLYPLTMVVLLINLLLHDLPQTILGMIFTFFRFYSSAPFLNSILLSSASRNVIKNQIKFISFMLASNPLHLIFELKILFNLV